MGPLTTFLIVVAIVALMAFAIGYAMFCFSSPKRWRDAILHVNLDAKQQSSRLEREPADLDEQLAENLRAVSERNFRAMLRRIEVEELKAYPGIGDVIVERLRGAGLQNLADLQYELPEIAGIGEKRVADIRHAIRELSKQAQKVFASNMCSESAAAANESLSLKQKRDAAERQLRDCLHSLDRYLQRIAPLVDRARAITLFRFLRSILERDSEFDEQL